MILLVFRMKVASGFIIVAVMLIINEKSFIRWIYLMASRNNDQDPVSGARRFVDCGTCGTLWFKRDSSYLSGVWPLCFIIIEVNLIMNEKRVLLFGFSLMASCNKV